MFESPNEGYTGRIFESEVLPALGDQWRNTAYFTEAKSYEWVEANQEWNPSDPANKIANELHYLVAQKLDLEDVNELKFYSALNSPLDYYYGIDAYFKIGDVKLTIDLSINPHKDIAKADLVLHQADLIDEEAIERTSSVIAKYLKKYADKASAIRKDLQ